MVAKKLEQKNPLFLKRKILELHFYEKKVKNNYVLIINWCTDTFKKKMPVSSKNRLFENLKWQT